MSRKRRVATEEFCVGDRVRVVSKELLDKYLEEHNGECRAFFVALMYNFCDSICAIKKINQRKRTVELEDINTKDWVWFDYELIEKVEDIECHESEALSSFLEGVMVE